MSQPERYEPRARRIGGPWKMVKCKDGPYVCHEQHAEIVAALAADKQAADRATFDAIRAFTVLKDEVAALQAENERLNERLMYLEATRPRDPHHGGKVYLMSFHESNEKLPVNPGRLFSEMNCIDEIASLKAEVERLNVNNIGCESSIKLLRYDISKLQAENERLRKAGDAVVGQFIYENKIESESWGVEYEPCELVKAWRAAKEEQS